MTQHRLYSAPWSTYGFLPALKLPGDSCEARFPLGKETASGRGKQHHCECTLTCEPKTHCTWENTMKVNPRNAAGFLRRAFSLKKTRKVGAVGCESYKFMVTLNARRLLPEKTHGIWKGFRDGRLRYGIWIYSHRERKTHFTWENIRNLEGVGTARLLHEKTQRFLRGWRERHLNLQLKWSPAAFYMRKHNDFSAVGGSDM